MTWFFVSAKNTEGQTNNGNFLWGFNGRKFDQNGSQDGLESGGGQQQLEWALVCLKMQNTERNSIGELQGCRQAGMTMASKF